MPPLNESVVVPPSEILKMLRKLIKGSEVILGFKELGLTEGSP